MFENGSFLRRRKRFKLNIGFIKKQSLNDRYVTYRMCMVPVLCFGEGTLSYISRTKIAFVSKVASLILPSEKGRHYLFNAITSRNPDDIKT